jgi:hypothetical protein
MSTPPNKRIQPKHPVSRRIEAYGVKGLRSRTWRRVFADAETLIDWCERNDAVVYGTRRVDGE